MIFEDTNTVINSSSVKYTTERISSATNIECSESGKQLSCKFEINNIASRGIKFNITHTDSNQVKSYRTLFVIYYSITQECQKFSTIKNFSIILKFKK